MATNRYLTTLDLKKFVYNKERGSLVAEASDFGPAREGRWWLQRLYDDACDVGIAIQSNLTDKVELFYLSEEETQNGELLAWHFKPVTEGLRVKTVTIIND